MARLNITGTATSGVGPYTYTFEVINPVYDITFQDAEGNTATNSIVVVSPNPSAVVTIQFDETLFVGNADLGLFRVTVDNGIVPAGAQEKTIPNPCYNYTVGITSLAVNDYKQTHLAVVNNGNSAFTYEWQVTNGTGVSIIGANNLSSVEIDTNQGTPYSLKLRVVDQNGCDASTTKNMPSANTNPVLESRAYFINPEDPVEDIIIDIAALASDADGYIDFSTIAILTAATKGTPVINTVQGFITYTPMAAQSGTDVMTVHVQDNAGNWSNVAIYTVEFTAIPGIPVATFNSITTPCDTAVLIDVLANDTIVNDVIDPDSLTILTQPLHGTVLIDADNKALYTPNTSFDGNDYFRVYIQGYSGQKSAQTPFSGTQYGLVRVIVGPCCDNHNADIDIACNDVGTIDFTASNLGTIPALATDTMEVDVGVGYGVGTNGVVGVTCTPATTDTYTSKHTTGGGDFLVGTGAASDIVVVDLTGGFYDITFNYANSILPDLAAQILAYVNAIVTAQDILVCGTYAGAPDKFLGEFISQVISTTDKLQFKYQKSSDNSWCSVDINADLVASHALIVAATYANKELMNVSQKTFGTIDNTVKFRRTVTRSNGCADVVVEKEITLTGLRKICATTQYTIASLQSGDGLGLQDFKNQYEVVDSDATKLTIDEIVVNGSNIIGMSYPFTDQGVQDLEDAINAWLGVNGGGTCAIYTYNTYTMIITVKETTKVFQNLITDTATTAFDAI